MSRLDADEEGHLVRIGCAIDLHATAADQREIAWERVQTQILAAEAAGFDLVLLPDHLLYVAGGEGSYAKEDAAVGVWEAVTIAGATAAVTSRVSIAHSMINTPYRAPSIVANIASTLDAVSGGRYQLGLGSGNSFDYKELGIAADHRADRFAEAVRIIHGLLKHGESTVHGRYWHSDGAQIVLRGPRPSGPPLVIAARGPRSLRVAARYGDSWNGECAPDPTYRALRSQLEQLEQACRAEGRDASTLGRTVDTLADPLDVYGMRSSTFEVIDGLRAFGIDEVRCYVASDSTHSSRLEGIRAMESVVADVHSGRG
jgi:alkanesulfonate monooxygenase SsuD/methylene tetrahydromethanopterin reductase-like flavin-dependent oxidoreductase (luciferase family)